MFTFTQNSGFIVSYFVKFSRVVLQNLFVILWKFDDFAEERDILSFLLTPNLSVALDFVKRRVCECFGANFPTSLEDVVNVALRTCIIIINTHTLA